jgi:hypothetical protein
MMPTVCRLLRVDSAVSGTISTTDAVELNKAGGMAIPADADAWYDPAWKGRE